MQSQGVIALLPILCHFSSPNHVLIYLKTLKSPIIPYSRIDRGSLRRVITLLPLLNVYAVLVAVGLYNLLIDSLMVRVCSVISLIYLAG